MTDPGLCATPSRPTVWQVAPGAVCADADRARAVALGLPVVEQPPDGGFFLARDEDGLGLCHGAEASAHNGLRCALTARSNRGERGGRRSPLARAFGLHRHPPMRVLDTTAGLGRDAKTLASLGCSVTAIERHPALYALLADASENTNKGSGEPGWWRHWSPPIHADARLWLARHGRAHAFDALYIDPMFDSPRRKSQPQKALVWLAELVGADDDAPALLAAARGYALLRVVVKQHARAAPIAPPDLQVRGRAIRFDVYLSARQS